MPAVVRSCFILCLLLAFFVASCLPVPAQINGVPPSVTSFGFGGSNNPTPGVRASVTSLGPNGYGNTPPVFGSCCANFFMPANPNPPLFPDRQFSDRHFFEHRHRHRRGGSFPVGISMPAYIPYAVPYAQDAGDDSLDDDPAYPAFPAGSRNDPRNQAPATAGAGDRDSVRKAGASDPQAPREPEQPVAAQPSTVLVFKDGHHSEVVNYAIVGETLFDFGAGRTRKILLADLDLPATRKANDERGVDFQIPASAKQP